MNISKFFLLFPILALMLIISTSNNVIVASSPSSPIYITNKAALFDILSKTLIPDIVAFALNNLTIPGNTITVPGFASAHLEYSAFKLSEFGILDVVFTNSAPNNLDMTVIDLSLTVPKVPFTLYDKLPIIGNVGCDGQFWANTTGANSQISLPFIKNDTAGGILDIGNISKYSISAGNLVVDHSVSGLLCQIGQDIIELFIKNLNQDIENVVKQMIGPLLAGTAKTLFQGIFAKIPLKLASSPYVDVSINAMTLPFDVLGFLQFVEEEGKKKKNFHHQQSSFSSQKRRRVLGRKENHQIASSSSSFQPPNVDISIDIPQNTFNDILTFLTAKGNLTFTALRPSKNLTTAFLRPYIPIAFSLCPNCELEIDIVNSISGNCGGNVSCAAPTIVMSNNTSSSSSGAEIDFFLHGTALRISAVTNDNKTMELFSLAFDGQGGLNDITFTIENLIIEQLPIIEFKLANLQNVTCQVKTSNVGPLQDTGAIAWLVQDLFNSLLIPLLDEFLTFKIPLPTKIGDSIYLTSPVFEVNKGNLAIGFDITIL